MRWSRPCLQQSPACAPSRRNVESFTLPFGTSDSSRVGRARSLHHAAMPDPMGALPLELFPTSGFDRSATTPVWLGVLVSWFFTETFGWVFGGLVVPGY